MTRTSRRFSALSALFLSTAVEALPFTPTYDTETTRRHLEDFGN